MKKIAIALVLAITLFANFSCSDHEIPLDPPIIETLTYNLIPTRVAEGRDVVLQWWLRFETLGTIPITEYGIVYNAGIEGETVGVTPLVTDSLSKEIPFSDVAVVDDGIFEIHGINAFEIIYYRAYAKLNNGQVIYGDIFSNRD